MSDRLFRSSGTVIRATVRTAALWAESEIFLIADVVDINFRLPERQFAYKLIFQGKSD
jgi:hypothetical protein